MRGKSGAWNFYSYRVKVRIEGFKIERLLTEAAAGGISMRGFRVISDTEAEGWISEKDFKKLKKTGRSLYRITIADRQGPLFLAKNILRRPVTAAGVIIASAIVFFQSLFVSAISIDGYKGIPEDSLRLCLEQSGIYVGAYRPGINWERARVNLTETFPQLTWIQLVYDGRMVVLNVAESSGKILSAEADPESDIFVPAERKDKYYCDLVADRTGYIESISTLWGKALVEPGDFVKKGDVLIAGCVPIEPTTFEENAPTEYYVRAKGEVTALTPYRLIFNQERYTVPAESENNVVVTHREKTEKQAETVAKQQIRLWIKENLPENAEIVNESLNFSWKNNIIETGVTLEVRQQIGIEKEIIVGQKNSDN